MREVAKKIKDYMIYMEASEKEFQLIENLNKGLVEISENNKNLIQKTIMKYATGELLTTGWGKFQEKRKKTKEKSELLAETTETFIWLKVSKQTREKPIEIRYLIYKKENN